MHIYVYGGFSKETCVDPSATTVDRPLLAPPPPRSVDTGRSRATIQHDLFSSQRPRGSFLRPRLLPAFRSGKQTSGRKQTPPSPSPFCLGWS